jgi:hypothetical protein
MSGGQYYNNKSMEKHIFIHRQKLKILCVLLEVLGSILVLEAGWTVFTLIFLSPQQRTLDCRFRWGETTSLNCYH